MDNTKKENYTCSMCGTTGTKNYFSKIVEGNPPVCLVCTHTDHPKTHLSDDPKLNRIGMKFDKDKLRYDLIPPEAKKWLAEVLTYGANKYAPDNWKHVDVERYYAALERHLVAYQLGEEKDKESNIHHLIHMLCNAMFICYLEIKGNGND